MATYRPVPLPPQFGGAQPSGKPTKTPPPDGAVKMQTWYIDTTGRRQRTHFEVPVDADDQRTEHLRMQCPQTRVVNGGGRERCPYHQWLLKDAAQFCPSHGQKLTAPKEGSRFVAVAKDTQVMFGRSVAPWALPAGALLADAAASLAGLGGGQVVATVPVLAGGAYYLTKRKLTRQAVANKRIEKGQRTGKRVQQIRRRAGRAAAAGGEAGMWATALVATDLSTWVGRIVAAACAVRWAVGMKPWWEAAEARRTRGADINLRVTVPQGPVTPAPDPMQLRAVATWKTLIGCSGGPLAGTELVEYTSLPACPVGMASRTVLPNWSAKVVATTAGSINMRESRPNLLGRIAAAYGCTYADVSFSADESDLGVAWLRVQPDNVLAEVKMWPGPQVANDWRHGRSRLGRFDDGLNIPYQWWNSTGAVHDLISGCSGSGKSETVAQLLLASLNSGGLVLDWVGDPQGGQSYGALKNAVDWFARDKTEITLMLLAALKEMLRRNDELSEAGQKTWRATRDMPLLVITLDEVQSFIEDTVILELVEKLVGQGRKCGIKLRLITQIAAAYNLGGSTYIKEQLKTGQTLIFRAMTDVAGRSAVEGDSPVDPTQLPMVWGKNTCAAGETTAGLLYAQGLHGRDVYGRVDWTGEDMLAWLVDEGGVPTISPGQFSLEAQRVSGVLWGDRHERAKRFLASGRADHDLLAGGKAVELIEAASANGNPAAATDLPAGAPVRDRARDVVLAAAVRLANAQGVVERPAIVQATTQVKDKTRDKALTDLVADDHLRRLRNGVYEVTDQGRVAAGKIPDVPLGDEAARAEQLEIVMTGKQQ